MASSLKGKTDSHLRLVSGEEAIVVPEGAHPTDESPTVISKTPPIIPGSSQEKIADLTRKSPSPESIVASLRGKKLAHYELIEPIGVGGMAAVIRARDTELDRFVALKILPPETAHENENVQRFHQEAKAAAKLDHENIARVFYCGEDQGLHFIAFEFVEGMNLRTLLEQRGRIPVAEAVRYILQVAAGLEHAATRGVVHRDVKPSNIIVTPTGRAKLVDMGLARNMERQGERDLTQSGVTLGTFDYVSPEQALEPRDADTRSDMYSLGCTFYHLLTGRPPVPEGTPARKLQFHQNEMPLDPRAIDPTIPSEIVMILGKMMAKNPKDRYLRPIHLVHHLIQVAQKVGAADDVPEGLLVVDAPLPGQPRSRPLLTIGLALAALVALTFLISFFTEPAGPYTKGNSGNGADKAPLAKKDGELVPPKVVGPATVDYPELVKTAAELDTVFKNAARDVRTALAYEENIDLPTTGLVYEGNADQTLQVTPDVSEYHAKVNFQYKSFGANAGIVLDSGKDITFRRIRFRIESAGNPEKAVAAVLVRGAQTVTFEQCVFEQNVPKFTSGKKTRIASVLIDTAGIDLARPPVINLRECCFEGSRESNNVGQAAIAVNGPATVNIKNCAFRAHNAFLQIRKDCNPLATTINVQDSAGFVVNGPAFRFDEKASAQLYVSNSVFSRPNDWVDQGSEPDLIYLADATPIQFVGEHNLYHNLNALVSKKYDIGGNIRSLDGFQNFLALTKGRDQNAVYLEQSDRSPWQQTDPLLTAGELAFQLKSNYHPAFGLKKTWIGDMPAPPAAVAAKMPPMVKKKFVDAEDPTPGVFANVEQALAGAKDGDVIYIRHGVSPDVIVSPVPLVSGISVTLKPDAGYQPRLVLNKKFRDKETSIFKLQEGKIEIEGMEIVLDPAQEPDVIQSIVQLGQAHCVFRNCVFTLVARNREQLSVVSSIDLDRMTKMDLLPQSAGRVEFIECFARGKGDLVALHGCRALSVEVTGCLIALDGSLLDIEAGTKSMAMGQGVRWDMKHTSVFTTESVFALRGRQGKVLTETNASVMNCLLASIVPDQPVALFERDRETDLATFLKWKGEQNFYGNFDRMRDWKEMYPEMKSTDGMLTFSLLDEKKLQQQHLWGASPDWFRTKDPAEAKLIQGVGQTTEAEQRMLQALLESESDEP